MAAINEYWGALGSETVVISNSNFSALASNSLVLSSDVTNVQGSGLGGVPYALLRLILTMATGATANTGFSIWFLKSTDGGTTYERGGTGYTPLRAPDLVIPAPTDTTQTETTRLVRVPPGHFKVLVKNDGTGQATKTDTTSAGSQASLIPVTRQMV